MHSVLRFLCWYACLRVKRHCVDWCLGKPVSRVVYFTSGGLSDRPFICVCNIQPRRNLEQPSTLHWTPLKRCNPTSAGAAGLESDTDRFCSAGAGLDMPLVTSRSTETHRARGTQFSNTLDHTEEKSSKRKETVIEDTEGEKVHAIQLSTKKDTCMHMCIHTQTFIYMNPI